MNIPIKRLLLVLTLLLLFAASVRAQPPVSDEERHARLRQRVEMMRIWKLTELLNLDEERAALFFPRYQRYVSDMDSLEQRQRRIDHAIEDAIAQEDAEYGALIEQARQLERTQLDRKLAFIESAGDLLEPREQAALLLFERRFHQRIRDMVMDLQREYGPPGGGPHGPGRGGGRHGRGWDGP